VKVDAGTRTGIRHFVAIYKGNAHFARSVSGRARLVVLPASLPNTGARWRVYLLLN
jgi:hypothetical protein